MGKTYLRDVRRITDRHAVEVSRKDVAVAWHRSPFRNMELTVLDNRYRALSEAAWQAVLEHVNANTEGYRSDAYDKDNFAQSFGGFMPTKLDINGVGLIIDTEAKNAYGAILVHNPEWAADKRLASRSLKIVAVEPQGEQWGMIAEDSELYQGLEGFGLFC